MKVWFDTEFIEDGKTIDLISIGMVREDGTELYLENKECDLSRASDWVKSNVIPHIHKDPSRIVTKGFMRDEIIDFLAGWRPEFWADFASYDWVVLCQLYGSMMDKPKGWPMFCMDIQQFRAQMGYPILPEQSEDTVHNALEDARHARRRWEFLNRFSLDQVLKSITR